MRGFFFFLLCGHFLLSSSQYTQLGDSLALVNTSKPEDGFSIQDKIVPCNNKLVLIDLDSDASFAASPPKFTLQKCGGSNSSRRIQQFIVDPIWGQLSLASPPPYLFPATCVDGGGSKVNTSVYPWLCRNASDPFHSNQRWNLTGTAIALNAVAPHYPMPLPLCISAGLPGEEPILEVGLVLALCDANSPAQNFALNIDDGTLRHMPRGEFCIDAGVIGRTLTWDGSVWKSKEIIPKACPDAGNPALLPRDRIGAYTVGHTSINGDKTKGDRLLVIGGDDSSNNMFWSDDCGTTWFCFDGDQPWSKFGVSFAPILTLDALPGSPLIMGGGFDNMRGHTQKLSSSLYYTFDGGADTWQQAYDLPFTGVFPGSLAQDRSSVYLFGGEETGFDVWTLNETTYNTSGFVQIPGSAFAQGADVGRRVFVRGKKSGGCFFATDFSPGALWGGISSATDISSSNLFSVAAKATGPWVTFPAPWEPRASAAVVLSRDGTLIYVAGGVLFENGAPSGGSLSDAWSVDASVCLLGSNGAVCSNNGKASLDTVTCACNDGYVPPVCASASISPSPLASATSMASASSSNRGGGTTQPNLSPGAIAGISLSVLSVFAGTGLYLFVAFFGGGPVLSSVLAYLPHLHGRSGSNERASLLARAKRGSPVSLPPQTSAAAAARFSSI